MLATEEVREIKINPDAFYPDTSLQQLFGMGQRTFCRFRKKNNLPFKIVGGKKVFRGADVITAITPQEVMQ